MRDWTWIEQIDYQNWLALQSILNLSDADGISTVDALTIL